MEAKLFIDGRWVEGGRPTQITSKYKGEVIGTMATARESDVEAAIAAAERAALVMAEMPAYKRAEILARAATMMREDSERLAHTIAGEAGKAIKFARIEVERAVCAMGLAAEEARRIHGETVPLDGVPNGEGYFGFWTRRPIGVVGAITPFNFPLNLVVHKLGPALAAGNAVVLKPAEITPLSAVALCEMLARAGVPDGALNLVHGDGPTVGAQIVSDPRVGKISFTGSYEVGREIVSRAGVKKVTLELGNNSPVVIAKDADLEKAAKRCAQGAFYYSGQVCISVQRIYVDRAVYQPFVNLLVEETNAIRVGDPLDDEVDVGPMIEEAQAERIESWVKEAKSEGAKVLCGGKREGAVYWPTLLADVSPDMKVVAREAFAPIACLVAVDDFEEGLAEAANTRYGLQAAVFTRDIERALGATRKLDFGGIVINDTPNFRADNMPYGGNRESGLGREGIRFAIEEMTNIQMVSIRLGG